MRDPATLVKEFLDMAISADPKDDPRQAGLVRRWHTVVHLSPQSVGEHSWQLCRILLAIWPSCPAHMLIHAITHDVGELRVGDMPSPAKTSLDLSDVLHKAEKSAHLKMCVPWALPAPVVLTEQESVVFKLVECIDMYEWALYELELGNRTAKFIRSRCLNMIASFMNSPHAEFIVRDAERYLERRDKVHLVRMGV